MDCFCRRKIKNNLFAKDAQAVLHVLKSPKKIAIHTSPLAKKNKKPATPRRLNQPFQSRFSMFRWYFSLLGNVWKRAVK